VWFNLWCECARNGTGELRNDEAMVLRFLEVAERREREKPT
jgi:hypothetical protein